MTKKFYKGKSDIVFKSIFLKEENRDMLEKLIEEAIDKKVHVLEVKASELPRSSVYEKGKILDVLVNSDEGEINIEVNSYSNKYLHRRNASYIFKRYSSTFPKGKGYSEMKNYIQINLTSDDDLDNSLDINMVSKYQLLEVNTKEAYIDNFTIYEFNISKIKRAWYNGDRKHSIMALLDANLSELDTMTKGDEMMDRFKDEVKNINSTLGDVQFMDPDEDAEMIFNTIVAYEKEKAQKEGIAEGKIEGIKENQIVVAKKLKDLNVNISIISKSTGLTVDEINNL